LQHLPPTTAAAATEWMHKPSSLRTSSSHESLTLKPTKVGETLKNFDEHSLCEGMFGMFFSFVVYYAPRSVTADAQMLKTLMTLIKS
jgi:hypothetical protein